MASSQSTFATLRALHLVIADALDDIQRVFLHNGLHDPPASPASQASSPVYPSSPVFSPPVSPFPATPLSATFPSSLHTDAGVPLVDYPSPDLPFDPDSPSELLALHPDAVAAATRIVAACGQLSNMVHKPFLSLCDAIMSYNLPACMRLVEHLHVAEILREAEEGRQHSLAAGTKLHVTKSVVDTLTRNPTDVFPEAESKSRFPAHASPDQLPHPIDGLGVSEITSVICSYAGANYVDSNDLTHALRLLSTHHIFRETAPDTFALNRVASLLDSGKSVRDVFSDPDAKYDDTGGTPAFVALITDELFKSAAYLTEAFTGVQLPTSHIASNLTSLANAASLTMPANQSATDSVGNDFVVATARSSSALTHVVYPESDDVLKGTPTPPCSCPANDLSGGPRLRSSPGEMPSSSAASEHSPPSNPLNPSPRLGERIHCGDGARSEKFLAFNLAFRTQAPYFEWLENGGEDPLRGTGKGASVRTPPLQMPITDSVRDGVQLGVPDNCGPRKSHRLQRFSNAMRGSIAWEAPKAILSGFDWHSLPEGSTIVDVGGGIGSTTMVLVRALSDARFGSAKKQDRGFDQGQLTPLSDASLVTGDETSNIASTRRSDLRFVVQDRPVVTTLGMEAWNSKCPEMLESGRVAFQNHDFFEPQSPLEPPHTTKHPSVYLLRVVLHDWPDESARRILINLRVASDPRTRLIIAEHVLPLACVDEDFSYLNCEAKEGGSSQQWSLNAALANIEGAERMLVAPPLLSNFGKASANAYWMDLIMHISLNGKERTLREFCALTLSAGWRITRMTRPEGLLFAYLVCEPVVLPDDAQAIYNAVALSTELATVVAVSSNEPIILSPVQGSRHKRLPPRPVSLLPSPALERSSSRCDTPTFGSRTMLPKDEELQNSRFRSYRTPKKWLKSKGLGVRSVVMQKVEKQREEVPSVVSPQDGDAQSVAPTSSSHIRVWWKKTPPGSTRNSSTSANELNCEEHRTTGRKRRGTLKSTDDPSTPSLRISPVRANWPSAESAVLLASESSPSISQSRRPSVASITRKLSFATFGRRPSIPDVAEPLPTPPPSATLTELAPPPTLSGDTRRKSIRHLPSLPTFGRNELRGSTIVGPPPIPRRPSFSLVDEVPIPQVPLKSGILKSRSKPNSPSAATSIDSMSAPIPRRQRRVTLSNALASSTSSRMLAQDVQSGRHALPYPADVGPGVRRVPSVPKLPRRLSIPMLRRKQSQCVVRDAENGS